MRFVYFVALGTLKGGSLLKHRESCLIDPNFHGRKRSSLMNARTNELLLRGVPEAMNGRFATKKATVGEEWMVSSSGSSSKFCTRLLVCLSFLKKLTASNIYYRGTACMEIPLDFCKTYGSRLKSLVELQGIHEESQVQIMACRATHGNPMRHFSRAEWRVFANENNLEVGQELLFTLTANSFFVVREVLPSSKEMHGP